MVRICPLQDVHERKGMETVYEKSTFIEGQRAAGATVRERGGIAPAFWAGVDIVPEHSEWDAVRAG